MFNRRKFLTTSLTGAGALTFTPLLNQLYAANAQAISIGQSGVPKRFVFIRKSNGMMPHLLVPPSFSENLKATDAKKGAFEESLDKHELPHCVKILEEYKEHVTILQGLSSKMSENGHYSHQSVMGCFKSGGGNVKALKRATVDCELGKLFPSPFGHVELSFAENAQGIVPGLSVPAPYQKNSCYADPITACRELFKCVLNPDMIKSDNDMLDYLRGQEKSRYHNLNEEDQKSLKNQIKTIETVRARNDKLLKNASSILKHLPDQELINTYGVPSGTTPKKQEAMTEVLLAALISGLTNSVTYTIDTLGTGITGLPGYEKLNINIHGVGHGGSDEKKDIRLKMDNQHMLQVKTMVERLKAQPEGSGTMFDNTMIMYFPDGGEAHHGTGSEEPIVIISGKNCNLNIAGKYIRLPYHATEGHQTLGNWYTTLLNAHGNPIPHYGDLDAAMIAKKLPQEGAIKSFIKA